MKDNEKYLISIVTVVFNGEKTIQKTIESVLNQTYKPMEYIIKDGLSTDKTLEIAKNYEKRFLDKGIKYRIISESDDGIYDAMNKGISITTGEIVGMINADDWYELETLEKVVSFYHQTHFEMMFGNLRIIKKNGKTTIKKSEMRKYVTTRNWNHPTTFATKKLYDQYHYKCESIYDDFDFMLKVRNANRRICILNETLANFQFGGVSNEKSLKKALERAKIRYRIYRNNQYSRFYFFESYGHELLKYFIA